jgi:TonB family protein
MPVNYSPGRSNFGLLPEPERSPASFISSAAVNGLILVLMLYIGATAKHVMEEHKYEDTILIVPTTPPPPEKVKLPEPPKIKPLEPPKLEMKYDPPKINIPKPELKPDLKPIQMEAKVTMPVVKAAKPSIILAPQPKAAFTAAMPAQSKDFKPSTKPVHLGDTFGVTPNPNATRPATVASIGNPYGGMNGPAVAPHGIVGSTGIGNSLTRVGSNSGVVGRVASAGIPGANGTANNGGTYANARVASAAIPKTQAAEPVQQAAVVQSKTDLEIVSKPSPQYTSEARQLKIEGNVVLRVTFTAGGTVVVQSLVRGLGHGLDEEARRVAQQIRFHPATRNGLAVDMTTNITITFQLA